MARINRRDQFIGIAQDGKPRTAVEIADLLGMSRPNTTTFLTNLQIVLAMGGSNWRIVRDRNEKNHTLWILKRRDKQAQTPMSDPIESDTPETLKK